MSNDGQRLFPNRLSGDEVLALVVPKDWRADSLYHLVRATEELLLSLWKNQVHFYNTMNPVHPKEGDEQSTGESS